MTLIAVVGATAAGKSDLAVDLALALDGEVINADSMQLYRGMDIGTAKLTAEERRGVPHHLLDVWDVTQAASVAEYQDLADAVIADITARGKVPVLVGGSGLYVRAALGDLDFPGTDEAIRERLEAELAERRPGAALRAAAGRGPRRGRRHPAEQRPQDRPRPRGHRAVRAPVQRDDARLRRGPPGGPDRRPGGPRAELDRRIEARVDRMWAAGFEAEVRQLAARGLRDGRTASRALGYQQMLRYLDGELTLDQARDETVRATRRFARRQESWFRRDPRVRWLARARDCAARALSEIAIGTGA